MSGQVIWIKPLPAAALRRYPRRLEVKETFMGSWEVRADQERQQFRDFPQACLVAGELIDPRLSKPCRAQC